MESPRNDLADALRELRPTPRPEFGAELDRRAAAGFPPPAESPQSAAQRLGRRLRALPPRRLIAATGVCAVGAIAVATAVVAVSEDQSGSTRTSAMRFASEGDSNNSFDTGAARVRPAPAIKRQSIPPLRAFNAGATAYEGSATPLRGTASSASAGDASGGSARGMERTAGGVQARGGGVLLEADRLSVGPYAARAERRRIERAAQIVLAADASEVRPAAAKVLRAVHSYEGIVLRSSIRADDGDQAAATFELLVPSAKLSDALAAFSRIAEVRSRQESTQDITAPTIGLGERLQDSRAKVAGLLAQLAEATSDAERAVAEAELRAERRHSARLRSRLSELQRRASFSRVSLRIESGEAAAERADDGGWSVADAFEDAAGILGVAAGVTVIVLAILLPLALICLLAWLAYRAWVRRARARALD